MKTLKVTYTWKHKPYKEEPQDIDGYLEGNGWFSTEGEAHSALLEFVTEESKYQYCDFVLEKSFRVNFN